MRYRGNRFQELQKNRIIQPNLSKNLSYTEKWAWSPMENIPRGEAITNTTVQYDANTSATTAPTVELTSSFHLSSLTLLVFRLAGRVKHSCTNAMHSFILYSWIRTAS